MHLKNKVALVTGAASERSIGWGIAQKLASEGASLILNDLPAHRVDLAARVDQLQELGVRAAMAPADITRPENVEEMIDLGMQVFGRLDVVCSNAGMIRWESFLDITPRTLRALVDINVKGNMLVCKAAAKQMIDQGAGGTYRGYFIGANLFPFPDNTGLWRNETCHACVYWCACAGAGPPQYKRSTMLAPGGFRPR